MRDTSEILKSRSNLDSFFIVLHGLAGCGKSSFAAALLAESNLIGSDFESVIWLRDSRSRPEQACYLFADLLLMLRDDVTLDLPHFDQMSSAILSKQIQDALIDRPNVLIVLDDVVQVDTVRWADRLGLRVLATTRDAELFAVAQSSVDIISIGGLSYMECQQLLGLNGIFAGEGCVKAWQAVNRAYEVSSGNPALLTILGKLSGGKYDRLSNYCRRLSDHGLSVISTTSSYEYCSLHVALSHSVERLSIVNRDCLACVAVMPSDQWISIEVWALVIPVDLCDQDDLLAMVREQLSRLHLCGCWLEEAEDGEAFRMNSLVAAYLKEAVEVGTTQAVLSIMESRVTSYLEDEKGNQNDIIREFFSRNASLFKFAIMLNQQ